MLTGGNEEPVRYAKLLARHNLAIHAIIFGPEVPEQIRNKAVSQFGSRPEVFITKRPESEDRLIELIREHDVKFGAACFFEYRVSSEFLSLFSNGVANVHPSALPHNAGMQSPFWGIMNGTLLGATLHWMNERIDKGDIIDQIIFDDDDILSAAEVRRISRECCMELYERCLPQIIGGGALRRPQDEGGLYHFSHEISHATKFQADQYITFEELLRLVRATDYKDNGFFIEKDGRLYKISGHVSLVEDN